MKQEPRQAFPLAWPLGYKRTTYRQNSPFRQSLDRSQRALHDEVRRMGGTNLVISTDLPVRNDGGIYAAYLDKLIPDPGVAVYFKYKGKEVVMCCDRYRRVWENIYALAKGIEALRGMERWGVSEFLDRAFTGFTALPPAYGEVVRQKNWWEILLCSQHDTDAVVKDSYRMLAKKYHPDSPSGDTVRFQELNAAFEEAKLSRPNLK